ncbi:aspartate aminotransferase family protein [Streptomyces collinus]|uniref:aspartate aminotransferase family protein n=1 Tax=Streptomyces collinus TaxID=42684 RepID=UPI0036CFFC73
MKPMNTPARARGRMNNAFDPDKLDDLDASAQALTRRRTESLGPAYRLFYQRPVHVVRGRGCRLWDADGDEYLDAYNNVVSVGHAHPHVVEAVHRQMETLCTHTRYLHEGIVGYASELLETFGGEVGAGHVMFTCTGSEANDLALRIAKHRTGREGVIVTAEAYHGNSAQTAGISPSLGENSPLGTWVRRVAAPDSYRVPPHDLAQRLADDVRTQIQDLERHGNGLAAFVVDSAFTSDGIYVEPAELLGPAVDAVRAAGGLLVADEVQCGFARMGDSLWGYRRHGVDPDIVTLGKPMGNGFPVAGLAVRRDVVRDFGHDVRYFNTFGGNTVAIAAAQATLDVIREEGLLEHARAVGAMLREGLLAIRQRHAGLIGDVRGSGLYLGVEIVSDPEAKTPDGARAGAIVNELRERRVLISATGRAGNVLKIRPPLVFSEDDAAHLLGELDAAVGAAVA